MLLSPIPHLPPPGAPSDLDGKPRFVYPCSPDALPLLNVLVLILLLSAVSTHLYSKNFALELLEWQDCAYALCFSETTAWLLSSGHDRCVRDCRGNRDGRA